MSRNLYSRAVCVGVVGAVGLAGVMRSGVALAQSASESDQSLAEIVVTATRRSDTVHNVPMTIDAVTTEQVEDQGLKTAQDIARVVPSLHISESNGANGNLDVAIRGIRSASGAATTGIYIDDVNVTQRNITQPLAGGTVLPQLFDLERVEVLQGPQGTRYGGSSEGGTVRYITAQPNLTTSAGKVKVEGATTKDGAPGYDVGASFGSPLVQNLLAFRLSAEFRRAGGYIDHVSQFTGNTLASNTNYVENTTVHGSLLWQPAEQASITLAYLFTRTFNHDTDNFWENIPAFFGPPFVGGPPPAGAPTAYGPYNMFGPYKSGMNTDVGRNFYTSDAQIKPVLQPSAQYLHLPSLTVNYDLGFGTLKSISAYAYTQANENGDVAYGDTQKVLGVPLYVASVPVYHSNFIRAATNKTFSQEFRLASNDTADSRLSWQGGLYYSHADLNSTAYIPANFGDLLSGALGVPLNPANNGIVLNFPESLTEKQWAVFGDTTYSVTEKFKATVGLRYTHNEFDAQAFQSGPLFGIPLNAPVQTINQREVDHPVTPLFGLQYVFDRNTQVYATAAKGFRPGGANSDLRTSPTCAAALIATYGAVANQPLTYPADSLWSYEAGLKTLLWDNRANINASVFYIDWKNPQLTVTLLDGCGQPTTISSKADIISKGGNFQGTFKVLDNLQLNANVGYTDSYFNGSVVAVPGTLPIFNKGDRVAFTSKWSVSVGGQYDFNVVTHKAFVRADYQYASSFVIGSGAGPGTSAYAIDNYSLPGTHFLSARAGVSISQLEWNLFVDNLTNSKDLLNRVGVGPASSPGRNCAGAVPATCAAPVVGAIDTTFRPRTIGLSAEYRY